jgi:glycosyltransferase involved in cell wall biosynthesis
VAVVPGRLSEQEWQELLQNVQAFVWMTHGEGFGLPIREGVLTGLPAVGTQWLGMHDIDKWGWPVPVARMEEAYANRTEEQMEANAPGAMWAVPDVDEAARMMQRVAEKYEEALEHARKGREYLMRGFTYEKTVEAMQQWLQQQTN